MYNTPDRSLLSISVSDAPGFLGRLLFVPWGYVLMYVVLCAIGITVLYSAVGGGENLKMVFNQIARLGVAFVVMLLIALCDPRFFRRHAYVIYGIVLFLLVLVFLFGIVGMGARRWIDLGVLRLQPSELMKVAIVLVLARYFHDRGVNRVLGVRDLWIPSILIVFPLALILKQPDLGTGILLLAIGGVVIFVAGLSWKLLFSLFFIGAASLPLAWNFLHDYQQKRILTLFSPEQDPLGSGYHIIQSKIAVGSGGLTGMGFMAGSQSRLEFLPEQHTDFIFSVLAEEWGFLGSITLLSLYAIIILRSIMIAISARDHFNMLVAVGMTLFIAFQVIINVGMVIGLLPVVGIPLPLVSYGGSSMLSLMMAAGLLCHVSIHSKRFD